MEALDQMTEKFPPEVIKELGYYVYRLLDPRNGETFYVGKGKENRVFQHIAGEISADDNELSSKLKRIYEITLNGFAVQHVIHRHGMDEATAYEVEAALIEAYPSVTNISGGHGNADRGVAHSKQIIQRYKAEPANLDDKIIEITINRLAAERSVYDATRYCWRMDRKRAENADIVLAVVNGLIVGVFIPDHWMDASPDNFPSFEFDESNLGRIGFKGKEAPLEVRNRYIHKRVPKREKGASNPIRYWNI